MLLHCSCNIFSNVFAIWCLWDSKLHYWTSSSKAQGPSAPPRPGEHRLQWRTWVASNFGVYRYRFLWLFPTRQPVWVTSKMPLSRWGGGHRSAIVHRPRSRGKETWEKDAVPMNLELQAKTNQELGSLQPRSIKNGSSGYCHCNIHKWSLDFGRVIIILISYFHELCHAMEYTSMIIIVLHTGNGILVSWIMSIVNNNHGFLIIKATIMDSYVAIVKNPSWF